MKISIHAIRSLLLLIGLASVLSHNELLNKELLANSNTEDLQAQFVIVRLNYSNLDIVGYYKFSQMYNDSLDSLRDYQKINNIYILTFDMSHAGWTSIISQFSSRQILYATKHTSVGSFRFPPDSLKETMYELSDLTKEPSSISSYWYRDSTLIDSIWHRVSITNIFDSISNKSNFEIYVFRHNYFGHLEWFVIGQAIEQSVGIEYQLNSQIENYKLLQNYPNPFNPITSINYSLSHPGDVTLIIYNLLGEEIATLVDDYRPAGEHTAVWKASNMASGIYFYRLQADDFIHTRKMVLLK